MLRTSFVLSLTCLLVVPSACSKLNSLQPGLYRAEIQVGGGAIPMQLRIDHQESVSQLWVVEGNQQALSESSIAGSTLQATLPHQLGTLSVQFDRNSLKGELRRSAESGKPEVFKLSARRDENYRFVKAPSTDNADISGNWRMQLPALSALISVAQVHDLIDGQLQFKEVSCDVTGQVHNDDVYLAAYCKSQLWLFTGKVNKQGELEGEAWCNHQASQHWVAKHTDEVVTPEDDTSRQVTLPWAVPTR